MQLRRRIPVIPAPRTIAANYHVLAPDLAESPLMADIRRQAETLPQDRIRGMDAGVNLLTTMDFSDADTVTMLTDVPPTFEEMTGAIETMLTDVRNTRDRGQATRRMVDRVIGVNPEGRIDVTLPPPAIGIIDERHVPRTNNDARMVIAEAPRTAVGADPTIAQQTMRRERHTALPTNDAISPIPISTATSRTSEPESYVVWLQRVRERLQQTPGVYEVIKDAITSGKVFATDVPHLQSALVFLVHEVEAQRGVAQSWRGTSKRWEETLQDAGESLSELLKVVEMIAKRRVADMPDWSHRIGPNTPGSPIGFRSAVADCTRYITQYLTTLNNNQEKQSKYIANLCEQNAQLTAQLAAAKAELEHRHAEGGDTHDTDTTF